MARGYGEGTYGSGSYGGAGLVPVDRVVISVTTFPVFMLSSSTAPGQALALLTDPAAQVVNDVGEDMVNN